MQDDISLKHKILADAVPPLSSSFKGKTSRLLMEHFGAEVPRGMGRVIVWQRPSLRIQLFTFLITAVLVTFLWQAHIQKSNEDELTQIDTMSMSSLLTL